MSIEKLRPAALPHDAKLENLDIFGQLITTFVWNKETCRNDIVFHSELRYVLKKYGCEIVILPGFRCDGGSIPQAFWPTVSDPYATRMLLGFLLHDPLYAAEFFPRSTCDWILLEIHEELGVSWKKRNEVWLAVKMGGWAVWRKHTPESIHDARQFARMIPFKPIIVGA